MIVFLRGLLLRILYPLVMLVGGFSQSFKERLQAKLIELNNRLVRAQQVKTKRILILIPHCLQINDCNIRVTNDIYNCKRCGRCGVKALIEIAERYDLKLFIATGGSVARKVVKEFKPEAIVAVACERDLSSGIVDSFPLPVLGVHNERPEGPCFNTRVNIDKVREAVEFFGRT